MIGPDVAILLLSATVVLLLTATVPQGIYGDPAVQFRALHQFVAGQSPSLNHVVAPSWTDLAQNHASWIVWWPPGPQLLTYPWHALGLSLGHSIRLTAALCLVLGALGWLHWLRQFPLPRPLALTAAAALPFLHTANATLFVFGPDVLNFAAAPWLLIIVLSLTTQSSPTRPVPAAWFAAGLALGLTYVLKYSLIFVAIGALTFLAITQWRHWRRVALAAMGCAIPVLSLSYLNSHFAGAVNSASQRLGFYPHWQSLVALIANPALAAADADGLLRFLLLHPNHPLVADDLAPAYVGLAGGLLILWLLAHATRVPALRHSPAAQLATTVFAVTLATLATVWTFSNNAADYMARHVAPASMAILPVVYLSARDLWHQRGAPTRAILGATALVFIVVPAFYGAVSVVGKAHRIPSDYNVGPAAVYNPLLASTNLAGVEQRIRDAYAPTTDIWYAADAITALDLPGRVIALENADFYPLDELRTIQFQTSTPQRITLLIPPHFETDGRGPTIRAEFLGAAPWHHATVPGSNYDVWTTVVAPR